MSKKIKVQRYSPNFWGISFLRESIPLNYLKVYLEALKVKTVITEPNYFENNYTAEFSAFYSQSAKDINHTCRRLLFFSEEFSRSDLRKITANDDAITSRMKNSFLGFVVQRPIEHAELGKTVLKWFTDLSPNEPRITNPSREYKVNFINLELSVNGVAWQQQDRGISACATVALWSILQSSAYQEESFIPTTRDLTENANLKISEGARVFPSPGLTIYQICEAIKQNMMSPILIEGNESLNSMNTSGFSRDVFCNYVGTLIKSGYPILLSGWTTTGERKKIVLSEGHAVSCMGYRSAASLQISAGEVGYEEGNIKNIYIHDDNFGPNVRFEIETTKVDRKEVVLLKPKSPDRTNYGSPSHEDPLLGHYEFLPSEMVIAINRDIFLGPQDLIKNGIYIGKGLSKKFEQACSLEKVDAIGLNMSFRYYNSVEYLKKEIDYLFMDGNGAIKAKIRLELKEKVYLSKHLGVIRFGLGSVPMLDLLVDTSNIDERTNIIAVIVFNEQFELIFDAFKASENIKFGPIIKGY